LNVHYFPYTIKYNFPDNPENTGSEKVFVFIGSFFYIDVRQVRRSIRSSGGYCCLSGKNEESHEMIETGTLIRMEKGKAVVRMEVQDGCQSCCINNYCRQTGTGKRELILPARNVKASPGDLVEIETPARSLITAAFLVFILPLVLSMTAYIIVYAQTAGHGVSLAAFFGCFILSEALVAGIDKLFGRSSYFEPRLLRRADTQRNEEKTG
jgi:positive regulator of sigma E activity